MCARARRRTWPPYPGATCLSEAPRPVSRLGAPLPEGGRAGGRRPRGGSRCAMTEAGDGWFEATLDRPRSRRPLHRTSWTGAASDRIPASRALPEGVHGPSEVVDTSAFAWTDGGWRGLALKDMVLYELHVGTFTPEGTFEAIVPRSPRGCGRWASPPSSSCRWRASPATRNWGYDGVGLFAPAALVRRAATGLQRLVDACHASRPGRRPGRRLQPSGPGGELPGGIRPLLHRPVPRRRGARR